MADFTQIRQFTTTAILLMISIMAVIFAGCNWAVNPADEMPSEPAVSINGSENVASSRTVTLTIRELGAATIDSMMISNKEDFSDAEWEVYSETKEWKVSDGTGLKTVYVKTMSSAGIVSTVSYATIILTDSSSPFNPSIVINNGDTVTQTATVTLSLSSNDDYGVTEMLLYFEGDKENAVWEPYTADKVLSIPSGYGTTRINAIFRDASGNESQVVFDEINFIAPLQEITSIAITPEFAELEGIGDSKQVDVIIKGAESLISSRLTLRFEPSVLNAVDIKTDGTGYLLTESGASVIVTDSTIDNNSGTVVVGIIGQESGFTGATGDGILFSVTFSALSQGNSNIYFYTTVDNECIVNVYDEQNAGFKRGQVEYSSAVLEVK